MTIFVCTSKLKAFLGAFTSQAIAIEAWRLTTSRLNGDFKVLPDPDRVGCSLIWKGETPMGSIIEHPVMQAPEHL